MSESSRELIQTIRSIGVFAVLSACMAAGYGVVFTIVGDYRDAYGISETSIGLVIGFGFLSAFCSQLLVAPIADRGRARQVVVVGVAVNVVGLLLMAFGTSLTPILIGRVISGIGIGAAGPAIRRIVVLADPDNLGRNLGAMLSADVFGFAIGPAISAVLVGPAGLAAPFVVVAAATVVLLIPALRVPVRETSEASGGGPKLGLDLLRQRAVAGGVAFAAGSFLMIGAFDALWDVVHVDLDTPEWMANLGITLFALPLILLGPISGKWAERYGPYRLATLGLIGAAGFMTAYGLVPSGTWIFGLAMGHAFVDGASIAASGIAVSRAVPEHRQASAQGLIGGAQALAGGFAAIIIGATYEAFGRATAYSVAAVGMIVMMAVGVALSKPHWANSAPPVPSEPVGVGL